MVNVEKYKARHILFTSPDYANIMDKAADHAEIHLYIKAVENPFVKK
jgi:exopolysaccharide biosynthesis predicted pyruvyltransferase EpsI